MKLALFSLIFLIISCSSDSDKVLEYENEYLQRKDVTEFIKNTDTSFDKFVSTNAKNIYSEYITLKEHLKNDLDINKLYKIQNLLTRKNHILLNIFETNFTNETNLKKYYDNKSKAYLVKHLHLNIDSLVKKLNRYDIDQSFVDKLILDVQEKPDLLDSYIEKYGAVAHFNKSFSLEYNTFESAVRDKIFDGKDFKLKTFNSQFGTHLIEKISDIKNRAFKFDSFERFKFYSDSIDYKNFRSEFKNYLKNYFAEKRIKYNYKIHAENIIQSFQDFNGMTEKDINNFKYTNRIIASFEINGKFFNIMMQDLQYSFIDNFYKKLIGIQDKPDLISQYIENVVDAFMLNNEIENQKYLKNYSEINSILAFIEKAKAYYQRSLRKVEISDDEIEKEYAKNIDLYIKPKSRMTYGFSVGASDSASLYKDYSKITRSNIISYYKKYTAYLAKSKNVKMRFLGDLQENSFGKVSEEVFRLKKNEISNIIKHNNLFYVFYFSEEKDEETIPLEQSAYKVKQNLIKEHEKTEMEKYVKDFEEIKNKIIIHL